MIFEELQKMFYNGKFEIRFIIQRDLLIYDDDQVEITNIEFCDRVLYIYVTLDCNV